MPKFSQVFLNDKEICVRTAGALDDAKSCRIAAKAPAVPMVNLDSCNVLKSKVRVANSEINFDGDLLMIEGVMTSKKEEGALCIAFPPAQVFPDGAFKSAVESAVIVAWARKEKI